MKRKPVIIGIVIVLCVGAGVNMVIKSRAAGDEGEATATVVSVQTGTLKSMTLHDYVNGYGMVEPAPATAGEPSADAPLAAPSAGTVARVMAFEGQQVAKGDVLVELNSGTATFASAQAELERQKTLISQQNTSLKNLQSAEAQLAALQVVAPISGTVTRLNAKPGAAVDSTTVLAEVMDLQRLAVSAELPAADATNLTAGMEVQVLAGSPVVANLSFVSPAVDTSSGTLLTRAPLPANSGLRPGQFVQLRIVTATHTNCLAAPAESVVTDEVGKSVIALVKNDSAAQTDVKTGFRENGWVEIEGEGLKEGDTVVTVGAYGLPDKTKIEIVNPSAEKTPSTNSEPAEAK